MIDSRTRGSKQRPNIRFPGRLERFWDNQLYKAATLGSRMTNLKKGQIWKIKTKCRLSDTAICGDSVAANINYISVLWESGGQGEVFIKPDL